MNAIRRKFDLARELTVREIHFALGTSLILLVVLAIVTNGFTAHFWSAVIVILCWTPGIALLARCYVLLMLVLFRWGRRRRPPFEPITAGIPIGPRKPAPLMAHAKPSRDD